MNANDIYGCIPLDTPLETICYQVESMTPTDVDKCNATLQRIIKQVLNGWMKNRFKKYRPYLFMLNEFPPTIRTTGTTDI